MFATVPRHERFSGPTIIKDLLKHLINKLYLIESTHFGTIKRKCEFSGTTENRKRKHQINLYKN